MCVFKSLLEMMDRQDDRGIRVSESSLSECLQMLGLFLLAGLDSPGLSSLCPEIWPC